MLFLDEIDDLIQKLKNHVAATPEQAVKLATPVSVSDPLDWLKNHVHLERFWWADRGYQSFRAGLAIADKLYGQFEESLDDVVAKLTQKTNQNPQFFYHVGFRFPSKNSPASEWRSFGYYRCILPLITLEKTPQTTLLSCHWLPRSGISIPQQLERTVAILGSLLHPKSTEEAPKISLADTPRIDQPNFENWEAQLIQAQQDFAAGKYDKMVLARKSSFELQTPIDPVNLLHQLHQKNTSPALFEFLHQTGPHTAFIGLSPEQLFKRNGRTLFTEAIAGTQDIHLPKERLQESQTALKEHELVRKMIQESLNPLCVSFQAQSDLQTLTLPKVSHLYQPFTCQLHPNIQDGDILSALFPTPAVAGYPVEASLNALDEWAVFDRGWYAGAIGYWSKDEIQLGVAIRSALLTETTLHVYSGAGIVPGSQPLSEWQELNDKISPFTEILYA